MTELPKAFCDLSAELFPITLEAFHPETNAIVWTTTVEQPPHGQKVSVYIPPLRKMFGHPVSIRCLYANGMVVEEGPVYHQ